MTAPHLGTTLLIANPTSHSGRGAEAARHAERLLGTSGVVPSLQTRLTKAPNDATRIAAHAAHVDTIVAVGGDGLVHEVVNGLMELPRRHRPTLAVVPTGSGNDFARTLGLARNSPRIAVGQLLGGRRTAFDVGSVSADDGTPVYFAQTLSFGLDAAIALDTTARRSQGTRQHGSGLFVTSGIRIMATARAGYPCAISLDGSEPRRIQELVLAVQNGPTYGGGFVICPGALPTDGRLDVCFNTRRPSIPKLLALFGLARKGLHAHSRVVELHAVRHLEVGFDQDEPPCQADGERLCGRRFSVSVMPGALDVIVP